MLHQNKEVKQEKGKHENRETGDAKQHRVQEGNVKDDGRSTRQTRLEQKDGKLQEGNLQQKKEAAHPTALSN